MQHSYELFIWWIWEDDKLVMPWQVLYSENLDLTWNSDFVNLAPKPTSLFTAWDNVNVFYDLKRWKNFLITGLDNKEIYVNGTKVYDAPYDVKVFWSNSEYLFWFDYSEDVYYIALSDVTYTWSWVWKVLNWQTGLANQSWDAYVIEEEGKAFLAYWTSLYTISNTTWLLIDSYDFIYEEVVWMTIIAWTIKIFQQDWRVFLWDWAWTSPSQSFSLSVSVAIVQQSANEEYVLWEGALYQLNWMSLIKIASSYNSDKMGLAKLRFKKIEANAIWFLKQITYIWWDSIWTIRDFTWTYEFWVNSAIVTFWSKKAWFPLAVNNWITTSSDWSWYDAIYWLKTKATDYAWYNDTLYIWYNNQNWLYWVDSIDLDAQNYTTPAWTWILIFPTFDWGNKNVMKKMNRIKIRADFDSDNWKFIFFKLENWNLVPINTDIAKSTIWDHSWDWLYELLINQNFLDMTIAVVLDQPFTQPKNNCIKLYSVTIDYEPTWR